MALRSPSSTRPDLGHRDSPPADSPPPTSQVGSGNGAKADVDRLLAKLEKEGVRIDDKIASIIDARMARIKAEVTDAVRGNINEPESDEGLTLPDTIAAVVLGFVLGGELYFFRVWYRNVRAAHRRV
ncbi:unnamed protein product [Urochloa decumbens]|uniref:DUF3618 domain-containing protein n=1 Tax=Urochloa decumbens TaxID=240449 RepID=A0ABC9D6K8_9POAL